MTPKNKSRDSFRKEREHFYDTLGEDFTWKSIRKALAEMWEMPTGAYRRAIQKGDDNFSWIPLTDTSWGDSSEDYPYKESLKGLLKEAYRPRTKPILTLAQWGFALRFGIPHHVTGNPETATIFLCLTNPSADTKSIKPTLETRLKETQELSASPSKCIFKEFLSKNNEDLFPIEDKPAPLLSLQEYVGAVEEWEKYVAFDPDKNITQEAILDHFFDQNRQWTTKPVVNTDQNILELEFARFLSNNQQHKQTKGGLPPLRLKDYAIHDYYLAKYYGHLFNHLPREHKWRPLSTLLKYENQGGEPPFHGAPICNLELNPLRCPDTAPLNINPNNPIAQATAAIIVRRLLDYIEAAERSLEDPSNKPPMKPIFFFRRYADHKKTIDDFLKGYTQHHDRNPLTQACNPKSKITSVDALLALARHCEERLHNETLREESSSHLTISHHITEIPFFLKFEYQGAYMSARNTWPTGMRPKKSYKEADQENYKKAFAAMVESMIEGSHTGSDSARETEEEPSD